MSGIGERWCDLMFLGFAAAVDVRFCLVASDVLQFCEAGVYMPQVSVSRTINAPLEMVFRTVADVREFAKVQPQIVDIQFLTEQQVGKGTKFRETRMMGKSKAATELEVTEYVENERIRFVADSMGTTWDTIFTVAAGPGGTTELTMVMEARGHTFLARLMNPLVMLMVKKAVVGDVDRVKAFCEAAK